MKAVEQGAYRLLLIITFLVIIVSGCAGPPSLQSGVAAQIAQGGPIYVRDCATELCHGLQGEGLPSGDGYRVWPLVGTEFEARIPNAQVIFDVVRSGSETNLRALSDEELYAAIAYELDQNGVQLALPLNDENAASVTSAAASIPGVWGTLYPPPSNARLLPPPPSPLDLPQSADSRMRLRVDQLAMASVIGQSVSLQGGYFVILVFAIQNLGVEDLRLDPLFLRMVDTTQEANFSAQANLAYPMERFHPLTIQPGYGAAGYEIFAISPGADFDHLVYGGPGEEPLVIDLR